MKNLLLSLFVLMPAFIFSQNTLRGKVIDFDSKLPISCATISLIGPYDFFEETTDWEGEFQFENLEAGEYSIEIYHANFHYYEKDILIEDKSEFIEVKLYHFDSTSFRLDDLAKEDNFDFIPTTYFFAPTTGNFSKSYISGFPLTLYSFEPKIKLSSFSQLGFRFSLLELSWMKFNDNVSITTQANEKERYFQASGSVFLYTRFLLTNIEKSNMRGLFFDLGAGYKVPYYHAYTYFTARHTKTSSIKISNLNDFEAMIRLGYSYGAFIATYRFTDIMKNNYFEPPKLLIGLEYSMPMFE